MNSIIYAVKMDHRNYCGVAILNVCGPYNQYSLNKSWWCLTCLISGIFILHIYRVGLHPTKLQGGRAVNKQPPPESEIVGGKTLWKIKGKRRKYEAGGHIRRGRV